jgi:stress response protein YsnF
MAKAITARFEREQDAERALDSLSSELNLIDSAVLSSGLAGTLTLDNLDLNPEERAACEQQLSKGGFLLVALAENPAEAEKAMAALDKISRGGEPPAPPRTTPPLEPLHAAPPAAVEEQPAAVEAPAVPQVAATSEERIPIVEEELRIGKREVVRGHSRVRSYMAEVPVQEEVELLYEETNVERRPVNRRLTEEELAAGGLLQERVFEITEMREEPVVTKETFVREELVVTKSVQRRIQQINDTVRRTEVETERFTPEDAELQALK